MTKKKTEEGRNKLAIFQDSEIRRILVGNEWYYSVVDVIGALTDSTNPRSYWSKLKERELENGIELSTICQQLKLISKDGKKRRTDCADNEGLLRIIQSVPSKKAEPFKRWLAKVGAERIEEIEQPGKAIERAKGYYLSKGYSQKWVQTRTASIDARSSFTDTLKDSGINEGKEYAILTNDMYRSWTNMTASEYKDHKGLEKGESLRDNMTPLELATTIFSEATAVEVIKETGADGFKETRNAIYLAGNITKEAVEKIESITGKKILTKKNMKELNSIDIQEKLIAQSLPEENSRDFYPKIKKPIEQDSKEKEEN